MLDKGTTKQDKFAIAQLLGSVGATLSFSTGPSSLNINAKCLRADLPLVIGLIAEQLRSPAFSPEEFAKLKKQFAGNYRRALDETDFRADDSLHPRRVSRRPPQPPGTLRRDSRQRRENHAR
jgi:zinc protease